MKSMKQSDILCDLKELFDTQQIGIINDNPLPVSGGLLHKMYKVTTVSNTYAVKQLNPALMKRAGVLDNMIHSELIANAISEYIPVVAAIQFDGQSVQPCKHNYYMVFPCIEGAAIFPADINIHHCHTIGSLLGKIHHLNITLPEIQKEHEYDAIGYDWNHYKELGKVANSSWMNHFTKVIDDLYLWTERVNIAMRELSKCMVISHRDLDPKNVMWNGDCPYLIDWEAAGYVNPYQELLEVLNYWSDTANGDLDREKFYSLLQGYTNYMNIEKIDWDIVLDSGYGGMLGWLNYNLKRALGLESPDENEKKLGEEQVTSTVNELLRYDTKRYAIKTWLTQYSLSSD